MTVADWIKDRIPVRWRKRSQRELYMRAQVAKRHLRGEGVEIGAMHHALTPHSKMK